MAKDMRARFGKSIAVSRALRRAAAVAMGEVLGAKKGERVLIITNPEKDVMQISLALYDASLDAGAAPLLVVQPAKSLLDFAEDGVIHALRSGPEIALSISTRKLGKDRFAMKKNYKHKGKSLDHIFNYLLASKQTRSFWSPSVTVEMFKKTVPIDYARLRRNCSGLKKALDRADRLHITTKKGTDLVLGLRGRKAFTDDGDFSRPGTGGNLPAGEVYISPELGVGEGTLVFDGCISSDRGVIIIRKPIKVTVKNNLVTTITGGREAGLLRATLERARKTTRRFAAEGKIPRRDLAAYLRNIRNLGELGIGLNEKATIVGNMLQDEKVFRTCHIAIGSNYDEDAKALIHLDGLVRAPTVELVSKAGRARVIMKEGRLVDQAGGLTLSK
jgi:hypothetical protein